MIKIHICNASHDEEMEALKEILNKVLKPKKVSGSGYSDRQYKEEIEFDFNEVEAKRNKK